MVNTKAVQLLFNCTAFIMMRTKLQQRIYLCLQGLFAGCADNLIDNLATLDEYDGGDVANAVLSNDVVARINVALADNDLLAILGSQLVDDRAYHTAGATPLCPEIDYHGLARCHQ